MYRSGISVCLSVFLSFPLTDKVFPFFYYLEDGKLVSITFLFSFQFYLNSPKVKKQVFKSFYYVRTKETIEQTCLSTSRGYK